MQNNFVLKNEEVGLADSALRPIAKTGREDWDNVMD
jgi:hypothetical protein